MLQRLAPLALIAVVGSACHHASTAVAQAPAAPPAPALVQPGAPGQATREIAPAQAADVTRTRITPADIAFMQGMIGHHQQAVEMAALVMTNSQSDDMKKLATRIDVSQRDEIKMMQTWLRAHGQEAPDEHAMHMGMDMGGGAHLMPGMLTEEEMKELAAAKGVAFDRLFLRGMIRHHGGALTMVQELFASPGAGQNSDIYAFASDVDADQRIEIDRMAIMLKELPQ